MATAPENVLSVGGVNVTVTVQVDDGGRVAGQLFVSEKCPEIWMLVIARSSFPPLARVSNLAWLAVPTATLPNDRPAGVMLTDDPFPVPLKLMECGDPEASSLITTEPVRDPATVGPNETERVQLPAAGTLLPQVSLSVKSPTVEIDEMDSGELPMLRKRTV
jgi:hypothetical protein